MLSHRLALAFSLLSILSISSACSRSPEQPQSEALEKKAETAKPEAEGEKVAEQEQPTEPIGPPADFVPLPNMEPAKMLLDTEALAKRLKEDNPPLLLDPRSKENYEAGHIPGAVWVDLEAWTKKGHSPHGLHDMEFWAKAVGDLGIDGDTEVVIYSHSPPDSARLWWILRYLGHMHVSLLDGGWPMWINQQFPVSSETPKVAAKSFTPVVQWNRLIEINELKREVAAIPETLKVREFGETTKRVISRTGAMRDNQVILDARSKAEYLGREDRGSSRDDSYYGRPRGGHIPGARHLDWRDLVDGLGRFKDRDELARLFESCGLTHEKTIITHCHSGGRSSVHAFALEMLGYPQVRNYFCSWQQWRSDYDAPVSQQEMR